MTRAYCCETNVNQSQAKQTPGRAEQGGMIGPTATERAMALASMAGSMLGWEQHNLSAQEDAVRRYILAQYPLHGRAPKVQEISLALGLTPDDTKTILQRLHEVDMLSLEPNSSLIRLAYPFSAVPTPHVVNFDRWPEAKSVYAPCVIDALGVAFMLRRDLSVMSSCATCAEPIAVTVRGQAIVTHNPSETVVWVGTIQEGPAATSACPAINFFCSRAHVDGWVRSQPNAVGSMVSLGEALSIGQSVFESLLTPRSQGSPEAPENHASASKAVAGTSIGALITAFFSSICCIGPVVFAALGVGVGATGLMADTAGVLKALLPYRPLFIGLTMILLGISIYLAYRKPTIGDASCQTCVPATDVRSNRRLIWIIAGFAVALVLAPYWLGL